MTRMSLRLSSCRSIRLSFTACMVALLAASPSVGEDPQSAYDETVAPDLIEEELIYERFSKLEKQLAILFPDSTVHLIPMTARVIVRGGAAEPEEAQRILQIVGAAAAAHSKYTNDQGTEVRDDVIVNMLELPPDPQVMLNVKFAIIERSQLKTLAAAAHIFGNHPSGEARGFSTLIDNGRVAQRLIEWINDDESSSIIATPTLTVLNGHVASLKYPASHPKFGLSFPYDLALDVKPDVIDRDFIKLEMTSSHSSVENGGESSRVATTVKLREGQSVVLSHDVASPAESKYRHIPLPGLSRTKAKADQSKVTLCIVTPELVHPMDPDDVPPLPGLQTTSPNDIELYRYAKSEGYPDTAESTLPPAHYLQDEVQYFPPSPEFRLTQTGIPPQLTGRSQWRGPRPGLIAPPDSTAEVQKVSAESTEAPEPVFNVTARMTNLQIDARESQVVELKSALKRVDGFDPEIIDIEPLGPNRVRLQALRQGVTTVVLTDANGRTWQVEVFVRGDTRRLQAIIRNEFPDCGVWAYPIGDDVALSGWVSLPEQITGIAELAEQFYPRVLNHMQIGAVQTSEFSGVRGGSSGELLPVPLAAPPAAFPAGVHLTQLLPTPIQQVSGSEPTDRMTHLRAAITALQAAGLTEQVRAVERAIEIEQIEQKQRDVEVLQQDIQTSRRRLGIPSPLPESPLPVAPQ